MTMLRSPLRCVSLALPVLFVLALAGAAEGQTSPILTLQATPSPFGPGQPISLQAEVSLRVPDDTWCFRWPHADSCDVVERHASVHIVGSNGFSDFAADDEQDNVTLQTSDPVPGQTMQTTTYAATGSIVLVYCTVVPHDPGVCQDEPQEYVEESDDPIYVVVHPIPAPSISSVNPPVGFVGTFVEITGSDFGASGTLTFNGAEATGYDLWEWTSTRIQAFVPGGATSGPVVVTTGGQSSSGVPMVVKPHIASLTPGSGAVGQSVTLTGTGFGSSGTVTFNGTPATSISSWGSTSITVLVPTDATTGQVVVTVEGQPSEGKWFIVTDGSGLGGTIQYYHTDALGSVRLITDAGGQVVATTDYLPFGDDWQPTGDLDARGFRADGAHV